MNNQDQQVGSQPESDAMKDQELAAEALQRAAKAQVDYLRLLAKAVVEDLRKGSANSCADA